MMVFMGSHVFQATPHIVGLVALCTGTYTHQFSSASGHSTHSWAYRPVNGDMNSVERDNNNPASVVSHHGSFDAIVMMFGVRLPVLLETQHIHSSKFLGGYQPYSWESNVSSPCNHPDFLHIRTCSLELCLIKEAGGVGREAVMCVVCVASVVVCALCVLCCVSCLRTYGMKREKGKGTRRKWKSQKKNKVKGSKGQRVKGHRVKGS